MRVLFVFAAAWTSAAAASFCDATDGWSLEWADEFDAPAVNESKWTVVVGQNLGACRDAVCDEDDVYVQDGSLVLRSRKLSGDANWTTGAVWTKGKAFWADDPAFRLCVSAKLPGGNGGGQGIWPAHWLMPEDDSCDPDEGEADILEMVDGNGVAEATYHWQDTWPAENCAYPRGHGEVYASRKMTGWDTGFHEYAVERARTHVAFLVDGEVILNATADAANASAPLLWPVPFHLILNTAIGGSWPGEPNATTVFPAYHEIDYVRVSRAH